ncbi:hypothetical protein K469DRAFT_585896, partial [Zopfia rhizophila CBS 207.26]
YSNVIGIQEESRMHEIDFTWGAIAFFVCYALSQFPQDRTAFSAFLQRFPVSKTLGINVFLWGVVTACIAVVKNSTQKIVLSVTERTGVKS